jgi:hypothetical protein
VESVRVEQGAVTFTVVSNLSAARCPTCATLSVRTHGGYHRRLTDLPIAGRPVRIEVAVRRFRCDNPSCGAATFAEQIPGLTAPFARRTAGLTEQLAAIGLALAGRAGSRLAAKLGMPTGRDTLLRLVRALPEPQAATPTVIGVNDLALRRGAVYGTVIIDMLTHRPIDVFPGREADTLAAWLQARPGIEIITRNRAGAYADGARRGVPQAIQVADRYHLWANLGATVEKTVAAHAACLSEPQIEQTGGSEEQHDGIGPQRTAPIKYPLARRNRERHTAIHELLAAGRSRTEVARELGISTRTVHRFVGTPLHQHLGKANNRASSLDQRPPAPALERRNPQRLCAAPRPPGPRLARRHPHRESLRRPAARAHGPATHHTEASETAQGHRMDHVRPRPPERRRRRPAQRLLARCPELEATRHHVGSFANMIQNLDGDRLPAWIDAVRADELPALRGFATGLTHDLAAVTPGLTLPRNNVPT